MVQLPMKLQKKTRNNLFTRKQTTKKALLIILWNFKVIKKVKLIYWNPKDCMKGKCYVFSEYKKTNKYFERKLQDERYS